MAEFTPEAAEAARVAIAGGFGSLVTVYLRHPGTIIRAACMVCIGIGLAVVFTEIVAGLFGWPVIPVAVVIGLCGKALAESALKAAERFDLSAWVKGRKDAE